MQNVHISFPLSGVITFHSREMKSQQTFVFSPAEDGAAATRLQAVNPDLGVKDTTCQRVRLSFLLLLAVTAQKESTPGAATHLSQNQQG